jgi:ADP-ribosylglycohydrolase
MNKTTINKIKGTIYGQVIGDALGLGAEFMSKEEVKANYPDGLTDYNQIVQDYHRSKWEKGAWTDDTDQFLCIMDSFLENGKLD